MIPFSQELLIYLYKIGPAVVLCPWMMVCQASPGGTVVKIPPAVAGDVGLILGWGKFPGGGGGNPRIKPTSPATAEQNHHCATSLISMDKNQLDTA